MFATGWCAPRRNVETQFIKGITVYPSLQTRIVKAIAVIIHSTVDVDFFAGEAIDVGAGECSAGRNGVAERIIAVARDHGLAAVEHVSDVAVAVGEIIRVTRPVAAGVAGGTSE